jgi:hypothetical protein
MGTGAMAGMVLNNTIHRAWYPLPHVQSHLYTFIVIPLGFVLFTASMELG